MQDLISGLVGASSDDEARGLLEEQLGAIDRSSIQTLKTEIDRLQRTDPQVALRAAELFLRLSANAPDPACAALSFWAKANALRELGDYSQAISCYDDASRLFGLGGDEVDAARTRIGKIDALMYLSRYEEASLEASAARRLLVKNQQHLQAAKLDANMGNLFHRTDRYHHALRRYNQARRVFSRLGEEVMVAQVDVNRANVFTVLDRFSSALRAYQKARVVFSQKGMKAVVAMIDANIGFLFHQRGRYNRALELYLSSSATFRELGIAKNAAAVDLDLAYVYLDLNNPSQCLTLCSNAAPLFEQLGMRAEQARSLVAMALAQAKLGQHLVALELLDEAKKLCELEDNLVQSAFVNLHRATLLLRDPMNSQSLDEALHLTREAGDVFQQNGIPDKSGLCLLVEGKIFALKQDHGKAAESFAGTLEIADRFSLPWLSYHGLHQQGRLLEGVDPKQSRLLYGKAIQILENMRGELRSENARNLFLGDKLQVYQDLVLLLLDAGDESAREAFQYVERAKSRALIDLLRGELEIRAEGETDQGLVKKIQTLREELNWFYSRLDDGEAKGRRLSLQRLEDIAGEVRNREDQLAHYVEQLQLASPEYSSLYGMYTPSLDEVQAMLDDDEALVEYYVAGTEILCFVVTRDDFKVQRGVSSSEAVSALSRRLAFQLSKFNYGDRYVGDHFRQLSKGMDECLGLLYDGLLRPIEKWIDDRKVIFVPHGGLHVLPFHAFCDRGRYFIQGHEVSYSPSAAVLKLCLNKKPSRLNRCLLLGVSDERAPLVETEVEAIGQLFHKPRRLVGQAATVKALREHSGSWDIVHIASHAMFSSGSPMFSRLKLADGWLSVYDIYNLRLNASLITLSSCQSGVGKTVGSDEIIGLSRGFLYAGAASLVSSLWSVNDSSTASLMRAFYYNLKKGYSKRAALREAQLQSQAEYQHPYYWAPFVLIGRSL